MSSSNFDILSLSEAIRTGTYQGENFDSLMKKETFLSSPELYNAAVKVINSYQNPQDLQAIKRAYDVLSNKDVSSLPIHKTGLISSFHMWGYNSARNTSEKIINSNFSEYLQVIAETPGLTIERKLANHDRQVESYLKSMGIPDSEWNTLKVLISQGKEKEAISQWNNILAKVRIALPGTFNGTQDVEDFLLQKKGVEQFAQPSSPIQKRLTSIIPALEPILSGSKNFPLILNVDNGVIRYGTPEQAALNHKKYQAHWIKLQVALLKGDDKLIREILNYPIEPKGTPKDFLSQLDKIAKPFIHPPDTSIKAIILGNNKEEKV